jgi:hypothetical protein
MAYGINGLYPLDEVAGLVDPTGTIDDLETGYDEVAAQWKLVESNRMRLGEDLFDGYAAALQDAALEVSSRAGTLLDRSDLHDDLYPYWDDGSHTCPTSDLYEQISGLECSGETLAETIRCARHANRLPLAA